MYNSDAVRKGLALAMSYAFAIGLVATALGITLLLQYITNYRILFPFFAAVIAAGWTGGRGPAWFAVGITLLTVDYFFAPPIHDLGVSGTSEAFFVPFAMATAIAGWCGSLRKRALDWTAQREKIIEP